MLKAVTTLHNKHVCHAETAMTSTDINDIFPREHWSAILWDYD